MYLRFITRFSDGYDEQCTGVFQAAYHLRNSGITTNYDEQYLRDLLCWFGDNLNAPTRFHKSRRKNAQHISLSWFKNTSTEHIARLYEMIWILEQYEIPVHRIKRRNPGYVIYEDDYQVSSIPYRKDKKAVL
jgi:hypothetical protein